MPAIVDFPAVVQEALRQFGPLFANEPERVHLAEYLTGLMVANRKTVSGINSEFAVTTDQSCLNRWLTEARWDVQQLNLLRLKWLQEDSSTRFSDRGVIPIDNVLIDHEGELIEDVGSFWDHADQRFKIAHDYLIANYVCPSGKSYPLEFRRFIKKAHCAQRNLPFRDHTVLFQELVQWIVEQQIPGQFTFDCWFTHADNLNYIHARKRGYVADLKAGRRIVWKGKELKAQEAAAQIPMNDRKAMDLGDHWQYYFTKSVRVPKVDHPVRIVFLWNHPSDEAPFKVLLTNHTQWEITRILRVYRERWRGTECFHRDGKQELGMGACQLRNGQGQTRHLYMVFLAYSILMRQLRQGRARAWALERLMTIGQACRAVLRETLSQTISWALQRLRVDNWKEQQIKAHLALP
jgi:hypothetical protein